ncbi:AAA family ATPase [Neomegalonema perideroedes]|uniref:AAA family ATPase n=1 Tax=Neomegalonema perideroedes TaxID=217219 RepID=UPI003898F8A3
MFLVTGASRAGKTSTLTALVSQETRWKHVVASSVLREIGRPLILRDHETAHQNQRALVDELHRRGLLNASNTILDGHAVLDVRSDPLPISNEDFDALGPSGIAVVRADVLCIQRRRIEAARPEMSFSSIERFQSEEIEHSRSQAERLSVPFLLLDSGDISALSRWLREAQA